MTDNKKQNFLQGALILSVATAVVKIIGALFKIPLGNLIGTHAMANFGSAYDIYAALFVLATAGLPVAVSKMVSESEARGRAGESRRVLHVALATFLVIGVVGAAGMYFGARKLAGFMGNPHAYAAVMAISPAVFFAAYMSAFRGYHQGQGNMMPSAISQVFEAAGKLVIGFGLAYYVYTNTQDLIWSAAAAIGGVSCGTVLGAIYITIVSRKGKTRMPVTETASIRRPGEIFKELMRVSIPITISSSVLTLTNMMDSMLVMQRLQSAAGFSLEAAQDVFGAYGYAKNLFNLPSAFILTLAVSVIPAISAAMTRKDLLSARKTTDTAVSVTALLSLPMAGGLMALSGPILNMLYPDQPEGALIAAPLLFTLGIAIPFVCLVPLTNAILQAMSDMRTPLISMSIGAAVKIVSNFILVGNPEINISGAPMGTVLCYTVIAVINVAVIIRRISPKRILSCLFKPLVSAAAMAVSAFWVQVALKPIMGNAISTIIAIMAGAALYAVLIVATGALHYEDILLLPKGKRITQILKIKEKM